MNTFLVPVDFSDNSRNALAYAIELAARSGSRILVCHAYEVDSVLPGLSGIMQEECNKEAQQKTASFVAGLDSSGITVDTFVQEGSTVEVISKAILENSVSLVVMGTGGGKNFVKKVFGTTAEAIAKRGLCPVLVLPENAVIKPLEHIVYAADFENGDEVTMIQLMQLKNLFNATLTFLHIKSEDQPDYIDDRYIKENLLNQFPEANLRFVEITNKNVAEGISVYVQANNVSLLVFTMINRHLLDKITHSSVTSKLLHNLKLPMLALPENGILLDLQIRGRSEAEQL